MTPKQHKILYILGAGRSGSTLFDIVLGNSPQICGSGELIHLPDRGWLNNEYCACGQRVNQCDFWRDVRRRWAGQLSADAVGRFLELQHRFERMRFLFFSDRLSGDPEFQEYLQYLNSLLLCVSEASGKAILVDSSKKYVRAFYLSRFSDFEVFLVHLVRDSRGVAFSKAKSLIKDLRAGVQADQRPAPVARTARHWLLTNLVCSCLFSFSHKGAGRYLRIRYEDFVADPVSVLRQIGEFCDVDLAQPIRNLIEGAKLQPEHTVAGNRLRMNSTVEIRPDFEWKQKLSAGQEATVWRWTGWLLRRYGYAR